MAVKELKAEKKPKRTAEEKEARKAAKKQKLEKAEAAEATAEMTAEAVEAKAEATRPQKTDQTLTCKDCSGEFVYTVKEQQFNEHKGFAPKVRCAACAKAKKAKFADEWSAEPVGSKSASSNESKTRCFNCGKVGHRSAECTQPQGSTACFLCGKEGHLSRDCPSAPPKPPATDPASTKCFNCGELGHMSKDCAQEKNEKGCYKCGKLGHSARHCRSAPAPINALDVPAIEALVAKRNAMRQAKDWAGADAAKLELKGLGVTVVDNDASGVGWYAGSKAKHKAAKPLALCFAFQKGQCERGAACHFAHAAPGPVE